MLQCHDSQSNQAHSTYLADLIVGNPIPQALKDLIWNTSVFHASLHTIVCFIKKFDGPGIFKMRQKLCTRHIWSWATQIHFNILPLISHIGEHPRNCPISVQWKQIISTICHFIWLYSFIHIMFLAVSSKTLAVFLVFFNEHFLYWG